MSAFAQGLNDFLSYSVNKFNDDSVSCSETIEIMTDICNYIELQQVYSKIMYNFQFNYSDIKNQLSVILNMVAPNYESINHGRFWVIMTLLRNALLNKLRNEIDLDTSALQSELVLLGVRYLDDWVCVEGGLSHITYDTYRKPASYFLCNSLYSLLQYLCNISKL